MKKVMGQLYRVGPLTQENRERAKPAQFVYSGNYDDYVRGFINDVDLENDEMEICLFEPAQMPDTLTRVIREVLPREEMAALLHKAIARNEEMRSHWVEVINQDSNTPNPLLN